MMTSELIKLDVDTWSQMPLFFNPNKFNNLNRIFSPSQSIRGLRQSKIWQYTMRYGRRHSSPDGTTLWQKDPWRTHRRSWCRQWVSTGIQNCTFYFFSNNANIQLVSQSCIQFRHDPPVYFGRDSDIFQLCFSVLRNIYAAGKAFVKKINK